MSVLRGFADLRVSNLVAASLERVDPLGTQFRPLEPLERAEVRRPEAASPRDGLVVMTWNIKFGGGRIDFFFDGHDDRVHLTEFEVINHLHGVAKKIRHVDPDILLLQEIDRRSRRVAGVDQLQWLLDHTDLSYGVYGSSWRARWMPAYNLGPVDMGNAILSKWPLLDGLRIDLPQMTDQPPLVNYFYLRRNLVTARIEVPGKAPVQVVNVHAEAFSRDHTKREQILRFAAELDRIDNAGGCVIGGGDLNTLPPHSRRRYGFEDAVQTEEHFQGSDYRHEEGWLDALYDRYTPAVSLEDYARDNTPHFTHSTHSGTFWNRKLDYLFTNSMFHEGSAVTHQDEASGGMQTMPLSDHAPLSASLIVPEGPRSL